LVCAAAASAQSLADVARQEEARRKTIRTSGKVYTNDALRPEPASAGPVAEAAPAPSVPAGEPPTPSAGAPAAETPTPTDPAAALGEAPRTEADWRKRVTDERDALSRAEIFADALQSRINVLSADFVNRDDPAQRGVVAADRQKALTELDRVKQEIEQHQKTMTAIQEEARRAGVPAGWVR
ncbi:MAG: hypothetical protein O3A20_09395, partial [Planctomycetota bacterium]|nr:hypothetical protein [Planctomycetota bacterium]